MRAPTIMAGESAQHTRAAKHEVHGADSASRLHEDILGSLQALSEAVRTETGRATLAMPVVNGLVM